MHKRKELILLVLPKMIGWVVNINNNKIEVIEAEAKIKEQEEDMMTMKMISRSLK